VLRRVLYLFELLEIAQTEESARCEFRAYCLFYFLGILESLLLSILEAVDKFCRWIARRIDKYTLVNFANLLFKERTKWQII